MTRTGVLAAIVVVGFTVAGVAHQQRARIPPTGAIKKVRDKFIVFPAIRTMAAGDVFAWKMAPLIDPMAGGSVIALPETLEKVLNGVRNRRHRHSQRKSCLSTWNTAALRCRVRSSM